MKVQNENTTAGEDLSYKIKTSIFEGPLGLLLHLVEKRKLFINDISLAEVTEDYLNYINTLGNISPDRISSFIVVASTLILIKSKSLLPELLLTDEEEGDIKRLEERLRLYKIFIDISGTVKKDFGKRIIFPAEERKLDTVVFLPDSQITKESMMTLVQDVLGRVPTKVFLPEVEVKKVVSLEEMIDKLTTRIQDSVKMSFKDFAGHAKTREDKVHVIVSFLAMLELVRGGILNAVQESGDGEIIIEKLN